MAAYPIDSLYGRAFAILNEWRGGRTTDDESISIRLVADYIRGAFSEVAATELARREQGGFAPPQEWMQRLSLPVSEGELKKGIWHYQAELPKGLWRWRGKRVMRVETTGGEAIVGVRGESEARMQLAPRSYRRQPGPLYFERQSQLLLMAPPRLAGLSGVVVEGLSIELPESGAVADERLTGPWWEATRTLVHQRHAPFVVSGYQLLDEKNDGKTT